MAQKIKLSSIQADIVEKMNNGWQMGRSSRLHIGLPPIVWIEKGGIGTGGEKIDVKAQVFNSMMARYIVAIVEETDGGQVRNGVALFQLTEDYITQNPEVKEAAKPEVKEQGKYVKIRLFENGNMSIDSNADSISVLGMLRFAEKNVWLKMVTPPVTPNPSNFKSENLVSQKHYDRPAEEVITEAKPEQI